MAVAEEVVIAGVEQLRVFAHEPAQRRVVSSGAILVEIERWGVVDGTICSCVFSSGEQETVVAKDARNGVASSLCTFFHQLSEFEFERAFAVLFSRAPDHLRNGSVSCSAKKLAHLL